MTDMTRAALLDAAEAAFATDGIEHVSLRSIMRAAGTNPAAVHYHFGSREALATAVLERLLDPLQQRRLELLEAVLATEVDRVPLEELVTCLVRPDLELALDVEQRNPGAAGIVGAIYARPADFVRARVEESFAPVAQRFLPHLVAAAPDVDEASLAWRVRWCVFGTLGALLADGVDELDEAAVERVLAQAVPALAAALAAPSPAPEEAA